MRVMSVNVSPIRTVEYNGRTVTTAIFKKPVRGPVQAAALGLEGDAQADKRYHGGVNMAVYAFTNEHYDHWQRELGRNDLHPGKFGENLTVEGMPESEVCIGDRFQMGGAEVEVSLPRAPCSKLAMVMDDPEFPKVFLATCNVGFYLRVIGPGPIAAGDAVSRTHVDPARLSIQEVTRLMYFDRDDRDGAARAASVEALAKEWREKFRRRL